MEDVLLPPSPMHTNLAQPGKAGLRIFGLCGLGDGVGKTEIAVEFMLLIARTLTQCSGFNAMNLL